MKLKIDANSVGKANPSYERVLYPLENDKDLKITVIPLKSYEASLYVSTDGTINFLKLLKDKVTKIEGFSVEFNNGEIREIKTIEELLNIPRAEEIENLLTSVTSQIIKPNTLSEDEEKN